MFSHQRWAVTQHTQKPIDAGCDAVTSAAVVIVDDLRELIPVTTQETDVVDIYLGDLIETLLEPSDMAGA
jgi:hypothetical protein